MLRILFSLFILVGCLSACRPTSAPNSTTQLTIADSSQTEIQALAAKPIANGAVALDSIVFSKDYGNCANENPCLRVRTSTIQVKGTAAADAINSTLRLSTAYFFVLGEEKATDKPMEQIGEQLHREFLELGGESPMSWEYEVGSTVLLNAHNLLSIDVGGMTYAGGAHPNHANTLLCFDTQSGKQLTLADIMKPNYQARLTQIVENKIRTLYEIPAGIALTEHGFFEDKIALTENFALTPKGITFHYSPYEVAPYAMGHIVVDIPFADIKDLIKPDGAAAPLLP
ncbi:MAG: DUF3298 domain-containing protein [Chitinophagales bacterium]|nr:DUF3298 domain-containing protein [Chitinophagales bacterium]